MADTLAPIRPDILEENQTNDNPDDKFAEDDDHDRFSHYVIGGSEAVMQALLFGTPVTALCGKRWIPTKDPKRFPVCQECKDIQDDRDPGLID